MMKTTSGRWVLVSILALGCSTGLGEPGTEGGPCFGNSTCNDGLTCLSDRCVRWDGDVGDEDFGRDVPLDTVPEVLDNGTDGTKEDLGPTEVPATDDGGSDDLMDVPDLPADLDVGSDGEDVRDDGSPTDVCQADCEVPPDPCPGDLCRVPAGLFWMGANVDDTQCPTNAKDPNARDNEVPCHQVTVPEFWIDRYEVTVGAYAAYLEAKGPDCVNPDDGKSCTPLGGINWGVGGRERHPMDVVTWYQARGFCFWAGKRLCSESEWEKAARGTDGRLYPWGNEAPTCERAVMKTGGYGACGNGNSFPVGSKPLGRSPYGVEDMLGNVSEMTQDWLWLYAEAPTDGSAREWGDEPPAADLQHRSLRGSSLADDAMYTRATLRNAIYLYQRNTAIGFRCCTSVAPR